MLRQTLVLSQPQQAFATKCLISPLPAERRLRWSMFGNDKK